MSSCSLSSRNSNGSRGRPPLIHQGKPPLVSTPSQILQRQELPVAAYFCSKDAPKGLDVSQPLLLYKHYISTKVRGVSLRLSKDLAAFSPVGSTLVIPDTYSGWFSVVTKKGETAVCYKTIGDLAHSQPTYFLTRFDVAAFAKEFTTADRNGVTYRRVTVQSGQVLKFLSVYEDLKAKTKSSERRTPAYNYAQCISHKGEILFIPFSASGKFFETAPRNSSNTDHVFLMSQILSTFQLPLTVRLVCGFMARVPQSFTGFLHLEKVEKEAVILACTITPEARATLLEMDVSSNFLLKPITDPLYSKSPIFLKSVSYCSEEADTWQRQIKVLHNVSRESSGSSCIGRWRSNKTTRSNSLNLNLSFVNGLNKVRGRPKDRSRTGSAESHQHFLSRKSMSRDGSISDFFRIHRPERKDSSMSNPTKDKIERESRIKFKVLDKLQDMSRNRHSIVNNEFISIKMDDKLSGKKSEDNRKVSKQNTYVFQNDRNNKKKDKKDNTQQENEPPTPRKTSVKSVENQEYAVVLDDVSNMQDIGLKMSDSVYSEICNYNFALDAVSSVSD